MILENKTTKLISEKLNSLVSGIEEIINKGIAENIFHSEDELYVRPKIKDFRYGDRGINPLSYGNEFVTKKSWVRATPKIIEEVKKIPEYEEALKPLADSFEQNKKISQDLEAFIKKIISEYLDSGQGEKTYKKVIIERFIDELLEKPIKCGAKIQLQGIVIRQIKIELTCGISIRQPNRGDLEKETPYYSLLCPSNQYSPLFALSAIADIEIKGRQPNRIQKQVLKLIAMLRLFKVGSVKYLSYQIYSDSITPFIPRALLYAEGNGIVVETSIIEQSDEQKLKLFWQKLYSILPPDLYDWDNEEVNNIGIAYERYSDALIKNNIFEGRVANAIMGLEALFLQNMPELSYRLSLRVAKIMSFFGENPKKVRRVIKDAYNVRSSFVHGEAKKDKKGLKQDTHNFLLSVLNYLRKSIVIMILIRKNKNKNDVLDLIDDSLIEKTSEDELKNLLSGAKEILV